MNDQITHRAFFGDGEHAFTLTDPMIAELERLTGTGFGALAFRVMRHEFHLSDLVEIIRLGLIGAGTHPEEAARMVDTYAHNRPVSEILPLALDVLIARVGVQDEQEQPA
ncbi:gene transfer agent family protein [Paenirhodobacter populi]|uniref:Gene transfer agent family protein n=1 Tax=Paenirhodobacter populi TaxID=2306993 RepID=A0A443JKP3_9RHOB|nr:gene transfer agent family protein [Sinirhodobacter populi]RWR21142.1 gene transfer agent family protein [Sinirhodobacter populi]